MVKRNVTAFSVPAFSHKEFVTLQAVAEGQNDKEIAHLLGIHRTTVTKRIRKMMHKVRVGNRIALVVWALQVGQLDLYALHVEHSWGE